MLIKGNVTKKEIFSGFGIKVNKLASYSSKFVSLKYLRDIQ